MTEIAPYGTWKSPIRAVDVASGAAGIGFPELVGDSVWWQERRPAEGGRTAILAASSGGEEPRVLLPAPWNARTRVHEYGGRSFLPVPSAGQGGQAGQAGAFDLVFANFADQRLYVISGASEDAAGPAEPRPLTPDGLGFRFADLVLAPSGTELWAVRETSVPDDGVPSPGFHTGGGMKVQRAIVAVPLDGSAAADPAAIRVLVSGAQFFAFPAPSPDGTKLAWVNWNHPNMPWDGTELRTAPVTDSGVSVADTALVMGGLSESVLAPVWRDEETLYAISDGSGWWNLYAVAASAGATPVPLHAAQEEFAGPLWELGYRPFLPLADGRLAVLHGLGEFHLGLLDPANGALTDVNLPGFRHHEMELAVSGNTVATVAGGPRTPWTILRIPLGGAAAPPRAEIIRQQPLPVPDPAYLPDARSVQLQVTPNGPVVHALLYPPTNSDYSAPAGELPPFVVHVHGGPTSNSRPVVSLEKAFFTSRGIGIIDVNYGGSTGYGRAYRERLKGQWGIVDVADAYAAVLSLADAGEADRARLGIRGGSAGGWTALASVTSGPRLTGTTEAVFSAATSYFGVSDLRPFATDTHDFESRYLDGMIGPLPESDAVYVDRAPVGHVTPLTCPILLFQGLDDPIVPPSQAEAIAADLAAHGIPHAYLAFEGESHGFRKAETIIATLEAEVAFYGALWGFTPPGVSPIKLS